MKNKNQNHFYRTAFYFAAFLLWTALVLFADVKPIGVQGTAVGLASLNRFVHSFFGVHMPLYVITDWLGLIPIGFMAAFATLGLSEWIRRKCLLKVDRNLLILGGFYFVLAAVFIFFETFVINYRPVLIDSVPEASYPSSTTLLCMCVMSTVSEALRVRIKNKIRRRWILSVITTFTVFMVVGRLVSGVHWFSDIVGGVLLSACLISLYKAVSENVCRPSQQS